ncbi:hypothetical protein T07_8086, partial [Trichinella nelsoni]
KQVVRKITAHQYRYIINLTDSQYRSEAEYGSCCLHAYVADGKLAGKRFFDISSSSSLLLIYILIVCCLIVAMPSGKRETERKGNTLVNTGPSPNSDGCTNTLVEEAYEAARGSDPLHVY